MPRRVPRPLSQAISPEHPGAREVPAPRQRRNRRRARTCRAAQLVFLYLVSYFFDSLVVSRASSPRFEGETPSTRFFKFVQSQMFYRQCALIYPNKNRTKISRFRTFFSPSSFYSDSRKNMGLHMEYFTVGRSDKDVGYNCSIRLRYKR